MSKATVRRLAFVIAGLVLLLGPLFVRSAVLGYNRRPYAPTESPSFSVATQPAPTTAASSTSIAASDVIHELRRGPVVVDLAHGNRIDRSQFEPLAAALANRGLGVRYWMSDIDPMTVTSFLEYPDQSEELGSLLRGASGLVVVSPFFLWSKAEIALVEQFVADGGRLLLISDPDVVGDLAQDINGLGEPFGIVFAGDYLYDTAEHDENHVYVYASEYAEDAAGLAGSRIAFYGTRSIAGEVTPQILTSETAQSNLRVGLTGLSAVVKGGLASRGTEGGVLAMGDFDVLTAPFVERHDNVRLTEFVADFLASGERTQDLADFPAYLGKHVTLVLANAPAVDSQTLKEGSKLQRSLEDSGRTLSVAGTGLLTGTMDRTTSAEAEGTTDLIVLADFTVASAETALLGDLGFTLVEVTPTPGPTDAATPSEPGHADPVPDPRLTPVTPEPTTTGSPEGAGAEITDPQAGAATVSTSSRGTRFWFARAQAQPEETQEPPGATPTSTSTPEPAAWPTSTKTPALTDTPSPADTPAPEAYLVKDDGLRLVAADTVLIAQRELDDGRRMVTVMGYDNEGIRSGIDRLLSGVFTGCVSSGDLAVCSDPNGGDTTTNGAAAARVAETAEAESEIDSATPEPSRPAEQFVMVIDDDDLSLPGEESEADIYLQVLTQQGYRPTLWTTASDGIPEPDDVDGYDWVIWSSGGYEAGGPGLADLDVLEDYVDGGGRLTISSRRPFYGMSAEDASVIADIAVDDDVPPMVQGLPSTAVRLEEGLPPVTPLEIDEGHAGARVVLRRGPDSSAEGAPLLYVVIDEERGEADGSRLMVAGLSLIWLPEDYALQLVRNMAGYMAGD